MSQNLSRGRRHACEEYREMWRTLKAGKVWQGVFHNKRKDGSMYWEAASISPVRDDDGEISYFIGVKEDITQRRKDEAQTLPAMESEAKAGRPQ
ncbi:PAS domain-containing protein [Thiolapillus sp.]|uniref:PAS domain-containing protein n=1 Tax=Thiolapillus sp. TaxID=2017437 RepID=UPI0025D3979F